MLTDSRSALADHPHVSAVILDSTSRDLCWHFQARGVPVVLYTGRAKIDDRWEAIPIVEKPALPEEVIARVEELLTRP